MSAQICFTDSATHKPSRYSGNEDNDKLKVMACLAWTLSWHRQFLTIFMSCMREMMMTVMSADLRSAQYRCASHARDAVMLPKGHSKKKWKPNRDRKKETGGLGRTQNLTQNLIQHSVEEK